VAEVASTVDLQELSKALVKHAAKSQGGTHGEDHAERGSPGLRVRPASSASHPARSGQRRATFGGRGTKPPEGAPPQLKSVESDESPLGRRRDRDDRGVLYQHQWEHCAEKLRKPERLPVRLWNRRTERAGSAAPARRTVASEALEHWSALQAVQADRARPAKPKARGKGPDAAGADTKKIWQARERSPEVGVPEEVATRFLSIAVAGPRDHTDSLRLLQCDRELRVVESPWPVRLRDQLVQ